MRIRRTAVLFVAVPLLAAPPNPGLNGTYTATAYAQHGVTASGQYAHLHVVAADPSVLPIGTRIKIKHAGRYSGEYVVADTGDKIDGRRLDIYLPSLRVARKFGVKRVRVQVLELGDGTRQTAKEADQKVKQDVTKDIQKGAVGNAATEADWAAKGAPVAAAVEGNGTGTSTQSSNTANPSTLSSSRPRSKAKNDAKPTSTSTQPPPPNFH